MSNEKYDYIELHGKCYPAKVLQSTINELFEGAMKHIIDNSNDPQSVVMRIATMQKDNKIRERIWKEAFAALEKQGLAKTREEVHRESGGKALVGSLDFSKFKRDNTA